MRLGAVLLLSLAVTTPAQAAGQRCGWFDNPTPGNFWLVDREREWTLATQGGQEAAGLDEMPDLTTRGWVATNGSHGYGCACMTVEIDRAAGLITRVLAAQPVPLKQCRADRQLPKR